MAEPWQVFACTFAAVFLAELGDKTQLAILALSLRGKRLQVLVGAISAFSLVNGLSAVLGSLIYRLLPLSLIRLAAALAFLLVGAAGLALVLLRERREEQAPPEGAQREAGILSALGLVSLAELGDKTQLATLSFSALTGEVLLVTLAAIAALASMTAITCALGQELAERLHGRKAELLAYAAFLAAGALMLIWP